MKPFFFFFGSREKKALTSGRRSGKNSGSATGEENGLFNVFVTVRNGLLTREHPLFVCLCVCVCVCVCLFISLCLSVSLSDYNGHQLERSTFCHYELSVEKKCFKAVIKRIDQG